MKARRDKSTRDRDTLTALIRTFDGRDFTVKDLTAIMWNFPPRQRIPANEIPSSLKTHRLAEYVGRDAGNHIWRSLI